jgi:sugar phosphate permease
LINVFATGALNSAVPNTLVTMWFPRKKGMAFGWATMGMPICTAIFPQIMHLLFGKVGVSPAFLVWGIVIVIFGILSIFWVKNSPEDVGCTPDNEPMSKEQIEANLKAEKSHVSQWTVGKLLKNKNVWMIGLGNGLHWLVTVGIVVQLVPRIVMAGYSTNFGLNMLTLAAVIGIAGSYFWGWLDQKTTTRLASIIYGVFYIAALIFLIFMENSFGFVMIATVLAGIGIGGVANLLPSLIATVFSRYDFVVACRVILPINVFIRSFAFAIMGFALTRFGNYTFAYVLFIVFCVIGCVFVGLVDKPIDNNISSGSQMNEPSVNQA